MAVAIEMDLEHDEYKQIEERVSKFLLPQEIEMKLVTKFKSLLRNNKLTMLHSNKYIANHNHLLLNGKQ